MNSLEQLNNYSNELVSFEDQRTGNYGIFTADTATDTAITVDEGSVFAVPLTVDLTAIIGAFSNVSYQVNYTTLSNSSIQWGNISGVVITTANGISTASNITTIAQWDSVKNPTIDLPRDQSGVFTITSNITLTNGATMVNTRSWTTTVTATDIIEMSVPNSVILANVAPTLLTSVPQIQDTENTSGNYTLVVLPSAPAQFGTLTTTGTQGGTSTWNNSTKVLTLTGNRASVNAHLNTLTYTHGTTGYDFVLSYQLTNPAGYVPGGLVTTVNQTLISQDNQYLTRPSNFSYTEDTTRTIAGPGVVDILNADSTPGYTLYIAPISQGTISSNIIVDTFDFGPTPFDLDGIITNGSGGNVVINRTTGSSQGNISNVQITGTRAQINSHLANISITPYRDYVGNIDLSYTVITPDSAVSSKVQTLFCTAQNIEITSNIYSSRSYDRNTVDNNFFATNTPLIPEIVSGSPYYAIQLRSTAGVFQTNIDVSGQQHNGNVQYVLEGVNTADRQSRAYNEFFYVNGTREECNQVFGNIKFIPVPNVVGGSTVNYRQRRNNVQQFVDIDIPLYGTSPVEEPDGVGIFTFTENGNLTINDNQLYTLKTDVLLVAGGGGAGGPGRYNGGGGAGGQAILLEDVSWHTYSNTAAISVNIGTGGAGNISYGEYFGSFGDASEMFGANGVSGTNSVISNQYGNILTALGGGGATSYFTSGKELRNRGGNIGTLIPGGGFSKSYTLTALPGSGDPDTVVTVLGAYGRGGGAGAGGNVAPYVTVYDHPVYGAMNINVDTINATGYAYSLSNPTLFGAWTANANVWVGGDGGPGFYSNISGNVTYYGGGGAGFALNSGGTNINGVADTVAHWPNYTEAPFAGGGAAGNLQLSNYNDLNSSNVTLAAEAWAPIIGSNGAAGYGGGGGAPSGSGGSGIVIIKFYQEPAEIPTVEPSNFANVVSLNHFNGGSGSISSSPDQIAARTWTATTGVMTTTVQKRFGTSSLYLPGSATAGSRMAYLGANSVWAWGYADYTIECWVKIVNLGNLSVLWDWRTANYQDTQTFSDGFVKVGTDIYYAIWCGSPLEIGTVAMATDRWYHIATTRKNGIVRTFINGQQDLVLSNKNINFTLTTAVPKLGSRYVGGGGGCSNLYIDDVRIVRGEALYINNFTPPTVAFSNS